MLRVLLLPLLRLPLLLSLLGLRPGLLVPVLRLLMMVLLVALLVVLRISE